MKKLIYILLFIFAVNSYSAVRYEVKCDVNLLNKSREMLFSQLGIKELTGRNDGYEIDKYLISAGYKKNSRFPYCAAGQYWCFYEASKITKSEIPIYRTGSTLLMFNKAVVKGIKTSFVPKNNDLIFWINANKSGGHVERIISVQKAGWVITIGFNTSSGTGNAREGEGVYKRKRNIYHIISRMTVRGLIGFK